MDIQFQPSHRIVQVEPPRTLRDKEKELLELMLSQPFEGSNELRSQVTHALVSSECEDCATIEFTVDRAARPAATPVRVPVEAIGPATDGEVTQVLLHVIDGYLAELELFRSGLGPAGLPPVEALTVRIGPTQ